MKIGIASPIIVNQFCDYLNEDISRKKLGLGGVSVTTIVKGLLEKGHEVVIYTLDRRIDTPKVLKGDQLKVYIGKYRKSAKLRMLDFFGYESNQIKNFVKQDNPDIVNAHWSYEFAVGAIKAKVPHLITFRDDACTILQIRKNIYRGIRLMIDKWVKIAGKNFSVNSKYLQNKINIDSKKLPILPNPIDITPFSGNSKSLETNQKIKIVSILNGAGNLKNPKPMIKAVYRLNKKINNKLSLTIFGTGYGENTQIYKWIKNRGYGQIVDIKGKVQHNVLMRKLNDYDILIHPSIEESFGNTLIEGMAAGIPVIGGKNSGAVPWVLDYGKSGVLVNVNDPKSIAEGIKKLIYNKDLYEKYSKNGIVYVKNNFSINTVAKEYIKLYKKIIN